MSIKFCGHPIISSGSYTLPRTHKLKFEEQRTINGHKYVFKVYKGASTSYVECFLSENNSFFHEFITKGIKENEIIDRILKETEVESEQTYFEDEEYIQFRLENNETELGVKIERMRMCRLELLSVNNRKKKNLQK